jgi:hypothetical protein
MSGGHFNYAYTRVNDFADQLDRDLAEPREWMAEFSPACIAKLHETKNLARVFAEIMREVEWLLSGDTSEETFFERFAKIENTD